MRKHPIDAYVGARVRQRRAVLGTSQADLDKAAGLSFPEAPKSKPADDKDPSRSDVPSRRPGRPAIWDWEKAKETFFGRYVASIDGLPLIQSEAEQWVAEWFRNHHPTGEHPDIREIRRRVVTPAYEAARDEIAKKADAGAKSQGKVGKFTRAPDSHI